MQVAGWQVDKCLVSSITVEMANEIHGGRMQVYNAFWLLQADLKFRLSKRYAAKLYID